MVVSLTRERYSILKNGANFSVLFFGRNPGCFCYCSLGIASRAQLLNGGAQLFHSVGDQAQDEVMDVSLTRGRYLPANSTGKRRRYQAVYGAPR